MYMYMYNSQQAMYSMYVHVHVHVYAHSRLDWSVDITVATSVCTAAYDSVISVQCVYMVVNVVLF